MRRHEYESRYNPAVTELSRALRNDRDINPDTLEKITRVLDGIEITDRIITEKDQVIVQKEQLLVQRERELESLRANTDNNSKVARDIVNESKGNFDKSKNLLESGKFSEALKYSDIALYNLEGIDNLGLNTIAQANNLYLERNQQYIEAAARRDYLYNSSNVNSVNAFSWVKSNPTRDFYTFFREALNIPDKEQQTPDNVRIINRLYELLPLYVEEAQRANYFYNEYNKYYDVKTKLEQVVNIHNIRAASSKGLKDYEEALTSCDIALEIEPTSATLLNLKNAILQEKQIVEARKLEEEQLLVSQTQEIETLRELLLVKDSEVHNKSAEKNRIIEELASNLLTKDEVIVSKDLKIGEVSQSVKKANRKLAAKDKLLNDKEQRLEELKALIEQAKIENGELLTQVANKSHMKNQIIDELEEEIELKEDEVVNLRIQNLEKELKTQEQEKLLIQKEMELADKNLIKNQVVNEAKKLLAQKDIEFQNLLDQNTELLEQNEVLDLKMQFYDKEVKNKETEKEILLTQKQKLSFLVSQKEQEFQNLLIQKEIEQKELLIAKELAVADKSFVKNHVIEQLREEIEGLNKQLLDNQPIYRSIYLEDRSCQPGESLVERQMASLDLSSINLSPINHSVQNQIVGNIIGNFDNQHITTSVALGGEGPSLFEIIQQESFN